jgi:hypothetical protein
MLDTVVLTLARPWFEIIEPERFSPSANVLLLPQYSVRSRGRFSCVLNPTKADRQTGRYWPRLALIRQKISSDWGLALRIEFSAPKLVFANNFDELQTCDFARVIEALHEALTSMGIHLSREALRRAPISAIHYSKNIPLTDYSTCSMAISDLQRIDLTKRLDLSRTDYRNEGHAIRYHANGFEVIFYDKLKDLEQALYSEKRGLEQDYVVQEQMSRRLASLAKEAQILRMEVRLGTRRKIKSVLKCIGVDTESTFEALFDARIAKSVLVQFWSPIQAQLPLIGGASLHRPEEIIAKLAIVGSGKVTPGKLMQQLGCIVLVDSIGVRGAGAALSRYCSRRSWQRYKRELKTLCLAKAAGYSALNQVEEALARFEPLQLKIFQVSATASSVARSDV